MMFLGGGVGGAGRIGGSGRRVASGPAAVGSLIGATIIRDPVTTSAPSGSPNVAGCCVALRFKGMARRIPMTGFGETADPMTVATGLTINIESPGFVGVNNPGTVTRQVKGTLPLKEPWPGTWAELPSNVRPRTYVSSNTTANNSAYYTVAGGTKGGAAPTAFNSAASGNVTDGGITWIPVSQSAFTGHVEATIDGDALVYVMLDYPVYANDTITSLTLTAGAYRAGGVVSREGVLGGAAIANLSPLVVEPVIAASASLPHQVFIGEAAEAIETEWLANHSWGSALGLGQMIAGMRTRIVDSAGTPLTAWVDVANSVLSNQYTTSASPSALSVECYRATNDASGLAAGDLFIEAEFFPWMGTPFRTREMGEGADWQAGTYVQMHAIKRVGANYYLYTTPGFTGAGAGPTGTTPGVSIEDGTAICTYWGNRSVPIQTRNIPARWHFRNDADSLFRRGHAFLSKTGSNQGTPTVHATYAAAYDAFLAGNSFGTIQAAAAAIQSYHSNSGVGPGNHNDTAGGTIWGTGVHSGVGASAAAIPAGNNWLEFKPCPAETGVEFITGAVKSAPPMFHVEVNTRAFNAGAPVSTDNIMFTSGADSGTAMQMFASAISFANITTTAFTGVSQAFQIATGYGSSFFRNVNFVGQVNIGNENSRAQVAQMFGCKYDPAVSGDVCLTVAHTAAGNWLRAPNTVAGATGMVGTGRGTSSGQYRSLFLTIQDSELIGSPANSGGTLLTLGNAAATATSLPTLGVALSGVLIESLGTSSRAMSLFGDAALFGGTNIVESNCTIVGTRRNGPYNDPTAAYSSQWFAHDNIWTFFNVIYDSTTHAGAPGSPLRQSARCQNYWMVYGVGCARNLVLLTPGSQNGVRGEPNSYGGLRGAGSGPFGPFNTGNVSAQFTSDRTGMGTGDGQGLGDYRPVSGALAVGLRTVRSRRFNHRGVSRPMTGAVGAFEAA